MTSSATFISPSIKRQSRLTKPSDNLRAMLIDAIRVVTGNGPRGADCSVWEARNNLAPKLIGVVSENVHFRARHWIAVTAPGPMMYGYRKLDLLRVCDDASTEERRVLLLELDIVERLSLLYNPRITTHQYEYLPSDLKFAVAPLFDDRVNPVPPYHNEFRGTVFGAWRF